FGQSVWLDYIRRDLISTGELQKLITNDGLRGMTSNPSIFEKAIAGNPDYQKDLNEFAKDKSLDAKAIYEHIAIEEARRLWKTVDRKNLMVKVPGTKEGIPAINQLIGEGININVTLLFAQDVYERVAEAYISGLESLAKRGGDVSTVAGVASFFISRIDTLIDEQIDAKDKASSDAGQKAALAKLRGQVAIANGKLTYQAYKRIFSGPRWAALATKGAKTQRVLWASTSTKDPKFSDVYYVEGLIGADTVDTIPPAPFDAFRDPGKPRASLEENVPAAQATMDNLAKAGISMKAATDKL